MIEEAPALTKSNFSCQLDCVCPCKKMHIHQRLLHIDFCIPVKLNCVWAAFIYSSKRFFFFILNEAKIENVIFASFVLTAVQTTETILIILFSIIFENTLNSKRGYTNAAKPEISSLIF